MSPQGNTSQPLLKVDHVPRSTKTFVTFRTLPPDIPNAHAPSRPASGSSVWRFCERGLKILILLVFMSLGNSISLALAAPEKLARSHWISPNVIYVPPDLGDEVDLVLTDQDWDEQGQSVARFKKTSTPPPNRGPLQGLIEHKSTTPVTSDLLQRWIRKPHFIRSPQGARTGVQTAPVIDHSFANKTSPLGAIWENDRTVTLRLWAPTAQEIQVKLSNGRKVAMSYQNTPEDVGIWSVRGDFANLSYVYEVTVFRRDLGRMTTVTTTDPYSVDTSSDGQWSKISDLRSQEPQGWSEFRAPVFARKADTVLYELHVRDFSQSLATVFKPAPAWLGTYLAFGKDHAGTRALKALADSGVTHIHLLPTFDFASVPEDRSSQKSPTIPDNPSPIGSEAAEAVERVRAQDGFNWGYDPVHFMVPDGSYATRPNNRILEHRQMALDLAQMGLKVVVDVVFNHMSGSRLQHSSVLDKIVPDYYFRLDGLGKIYNSTCCANTASEHIMMARLVKDSIRHWAKEYKVGGFRFDLMGHMPKALLVEVRDMLQTMEQQNGGPYVLYGEGWDFGEVAGGRLFENASQRNMAGTAIATFSDRGRDAIRGGSPSGEPSIRGIATGLGAIPSENAELLRLQDVLEVDLTGNLKNFEIQNFQNQSKKGSEVFFQGESAGYAKDPIDVVRYVGAHDNETLFDAIMWKTTGSHSNDARSQMALLAMSFVALGQGIPFFHAGDEFLRSKSLDRNSYDSGDHFNVLDYELSDPGWGKGLPPGPSNRPLWPRMKEIALRGAPDNSLLEQTQEAFLNLLKIRKSSLLFRKETESEIKQGMSFLYSPSGKTPHLTAVEYRRSSAIESQDPFRRIVVLWNSGTAKLKFSHPKLSGLQIHPLSPGAATFKDQNTVELSPRSYSVWAE